MGIVQNELVKCINARHRYPVPPDCQIYFPMGPVVLNTNAFDGKVGEKIQVRYNGNPVINGNKTGNGHLFLYLTYNIRFQDAGTE